MRKLCMAHMSRKQWEEEESRPAGECTREEDLKGKKK